MIGVEAGEKTEEPVPTTEEAPIIDSNDNTPILN